MKNNRFKQTKQKQQKQQKKQTKQTKHKRRMQYGGKKYNYFNYSTILKTDAPNKQVVIPGYPDISDMIKEYTESVSIQKQLDAGIKSKNVVVYDSCEIPKTNTPDTSIILLKKGVFLSFASNSIDCDDETYLSLASHNFKIFIIHILKWNPFLPNLHPKPEEPARQQYGSNHTYNQSGQFSYKFTKKSWWDSQQWWRVSGLPTYASLVPTTQPPPLRAAPPPIQEPQSQPIDSNDANIRVLKIQIAGLTSHVTRLTQENTALTIKNQELMKRIKELEPETKKDR
jgi:hypothetical protein